MTGMPSGTAASDAAAQSSRAIFFMVIGTAILSLNDGLVKLLSEGYPVGQLLFMRSMLVLPWILVLAWKDGGLRQLKVSSIKGQLLRGVCVIGSAFLFVIGLTYLPLATAIAVAFSGPLFITAMAPMMLGETVGWRRWVAVLGGFAGVLVMVRPGSDTMQWAVLLPLAAALCGGMRDIITRRIAQTETTVAVLLVTVAAIALAGLATAPFGWVPLRSADLWVFAFSGFLFPCAHYLIIDSFRNGEASLVAPFKYTSMVWAILFGFLMFAEMPDEWTLAGSGIVILAGLYIMRREAVLRRRKVATKVRRPSA